MKRKKEVRLPTYFISWSRKTKSSLKIFSCLLVRGQCPYYLDASKYPKENINLNGVILSSSASRNLAVLPSPSSLCLPHNRPINQRRVEARNTILFGKLADQEDGRLVTPKNHLIGVWMPVSFIDREEEDVRK